MLNKVKNFFKPKKVAKAVSKQKLDIMNKPKTAVQLAQETIYAERVKRHNEKCETLAKGYTERLNEHLSAYFNNFSDDEQTNEFAYDLLNKEWKAYVQRVNATNKLFQLKSNSFENECATIISKNPQFQKQAVVDFSQIKGE